LKGVGKGIGKHETEAKMNNMHLKEWGEGKFFNFLKM